VYGFYQIGQGNKHRRFVLDEKHNARAILVPFLQSEEDRRYAREAREMRERESVVMKNVRGWNSEEKPYKTTWLSPGSATRPRLI
jgi:NADH dehydrogenase (ubiquinone) 1 alpha subcomplex subunit 13